MKLVTNIIAPGAAGVKPGATFAEAQAFLAVVQPAPEPGETLEARYLCPHKRRAPVARFYRTAQALLADVPRYRDERNCYVGICLRRGTDGTAAGVSRAGCCWTDIDAKLWASEPDPKAAALAAVEAFTPRPAVVVDSGGGYQAYWLLAEPVHVQAPGVRERLEAVNAALARAVCGADRRPDHVHDVARIFRLPDTLNRKPEYGAPRPVRLVRIEPGVRYTLAELHAVLTELHPCALHTPTSATPGAYPAPASPLGDLRDRRIRRATLALLDSAGPAGYQSASEADAAIAAALVGAGLTEGEALGVLLASARGRDAYDRKGSRHAEGYWRRTVAHAAAYVGPVVERADRSRIRRLPVLRRPRGVPPPPLVRPKGVPAVSYMRAKGVQW